MSQVTTKSRIALISGANQGIGQAVATSLAKEHGFTVIIGSRNLSTGQAVADKLRAAGHAATAVQLDVTSDASIAAAVATIDASFGRLDVLVNNAGVNLDEGANTFRPQPKLAPRELFERTFGTNVIGTACLTEALLPLLRRSEQGGPRIVFVSSSMGSFSHATDRNSPIWKIDYKAYDSSKAAVNMLAVNYARILEPVGGSVNAACPGLVSTNLVGFTEAGAPVELGARRIVELATMEDPPNGTYSDKDGPIAW